MYKRGFFIDFIFLSPRIVVLFLPMTMLKNSPKNLQRATIEVDDYYAMARKRIAEETQKAHRIHEENIQTHITAMIPYYDESEGEDSRRLLLLNSLLIHRFEEPGMMYWNIFRNNPWEIEDYADLFWDELSEEDRQAIIDFLQFKKNEDNSMVDMGFDEDWEEDDFIVTKEFNEIENGRHEEYKDTEEE